MSDREELFERLSDGKENAEQVSVEPDAEAETVAVELEELSAEFDPEEARSFSETLEADAREDGWYHSGQTKPLIDEIQDAAERID